MAGLKLEGLSIWTSKFTDRGGVNVLLPSKPGAPKPDGKKSYYDLLRCADSEDRRALFAFKDFVIAEFTKWQNGGAAPAGSSFALDGGRPAAEELSADEIPF